MVLVYNLDSKCEIKLKNKSPNQNEDIFIFWNVNKKGWSPVGFRDSFLNQDILK